MADRFDLSSLARRALAHSAAGTTDLADGTMSVPVADYADPDVWHADVEVIFGGRPVPVALTAELVRPGDYKAMDLGPLPVIVARGADGRVRTHVNVCRHRGARLCAPGTGNATKFTCPYHGWKYNSAGSLVGIHRAHQFGDVDRDDRSLVQVPTVERHGFVWAAPGAEEPLDVDAWLGPEFTAELEKVGLQDWTFHDQIELPGANWKLVFDGYLEGYHGDHLHADTLGEGSISNLVLHDPYGPHQRMVFVQTSVEELRGSPETDWDPSPHLVPNHIIFPNVSLAGGWHETGMVCIVLPGRTPDTSMTYQTVLTRDPVRDRRHEAAVRAFSGLMVRVARDEDYPCVDALQQGLDCGANSTFLLGRNELAVQHQHRALQALHS